MNIFERGTRGKIRFTAPGKGGQLTMEDLFDLPLTGNRNFNLDTLAVGIYNDLQTQGQVSFVATAENSERALLELKMEIVKHVIAAKQADVQRAESAAATRARKQHLEGVLATKEQQADLEKTPEQIKAELAALGV